MPEHIFTELSLKDQQLMQGIFDGRLTPPLHSDIIAKKVLNPDVHPDRMNFLLRGISKDSTIEVRSGAGNELPHQSYYAKAMVTDIPSWLMDGRLSDLEIQKAAQDFVFTRGDLYGSDMLLLQYTVLPGQAKESLDYTNVKESIVVFLMVESPKPFKDYYEKSERYIHRFTTLTADSGLSYDRKIKLIYVQLDKCLEQLKKGTNAESGDGKPDQLQMWLAAFADVNDEKVVAGADEELEKMRQEAFLMGQDKEVQNMLLAEKYEKMDWVTYGNEREEKGETKRARETAKRMIDDKKLSFEDIAKYSGLKLSEVKELAGAAKV